MAKFNPAKAASDVFASVAGFVQRVVDPLTARVDKHHASIESAEHRLSRHADHLRRLEDRLRRLEHGGDR